MSEIENTTLESNKSGMQCEYLVIKELPTNFRSYDAKELYTRGLFYEESLSLSKYIGPGRDINYSQLVSIYDDVIRGVDLNKLEVIDFNVLMIISSIYTVDEFGWNPNIRCSVVDEDGIQCDGMITEKIILDDFEFSDPLVDELPIPSNIGTNEVSIGAVTVQDEIDKEQYLKDNPDTPKKILDYAVLIKNDDKSFEEKINMIKYSYKRDLENISKINSEVHIKVNPVIKKCPKCGHPNKLEISLNRVRGYP